MGTIWTRNSRVLVGAVATCFALALVIASMLAPARAHGATIYTQYTYTYKILSKTKLTDEFSAYSRVGNVLYLQPGNQYPKITAKSKTIEYSMSVKLGTPIPNVAANLGVKTTEATYKFSGMISAHAAKTKPYCAPYYRTAWHRWSVVEQVTKLGRSAKTMKWETLSTTKQTSTVRIPFVDSKAYMFGWAKTKAELGTSISKSSDARFVQ